MTEDTKRIRVALSERPPVLISAKEWPVIAGAKDFSGGSDHACQANEEYWIKVRQHADGRTLVYCRRHRGPGGMHAGYRGAEGGWLLANPSQSDIIVAIRRCGGIIQDSGVAQDCISDLPAEEL